MNPKSWYADIEPDAPAQINTDQAESETEERARRRKRRVTGTLWLFAGCTWADILGGGPHWGAVALSLAAVAVTAYGMGGSARFGGRGG